MLKAEQNDRLTKVGPGTPMGELMRRYWQPVATCEELAENPVLSVKILGETLTLFKTREGELGLIGQRCAHRGVDMRHGLPEDRGLRCPYHGWLYDTTGHCMEQPPEDPESNFPQRIKLDGYPVKTLGGLVWAYLGPDPAPELPEWSLFVDDNVFRQIGTTVVPCNWLQCQENALDTVHLTYVHGEYMAYALERKGVEDPRAWDLANKLRALEHDKVRFERVPHGIQKYRLFKGRSEIDNPGWEIGHPMVFPNMVLIGAAGLREFQIRVPIDDTTTWHLTYQAYTPAPGVKVPEQNPVPTFEVPDEDLPVYVLSQDVLAWRAQGPIADRTEEHLTPTDHGIILFRKMLEEQLQVVESGEDPMNVFRVPGQCSEVELVQEPVGPLDESVGNPYNFGRCLGAPIHDALPRLLGRELQT